MITKERAKQLIAEKFKGQAVDDEDKCQYLTDDGKRCVIGCFIPDGHEALKSGGGVQHILRRYRDLWDYMPTDDIVELRELQVLHDDYLDYDDGVEAQKETLIMQIETLYY